MERDRFGPVAIHLTPRNFRTSALKFWFNGLRPLSLVFGILHNNDLPWFHVKAEFLPMIVFLCFKQGTNSSPRNWWGHNNSNRWRQGGADYPPTLPCCLSSHSRILGSQEDASVGFVLSSRQRQKLGGITSRVQKHHSIMANSTEGGWFGGFDSGSWQR